MKIALRNYARSLLTSPAFWAGFILGIVYLFFR